MPAQGDLVYLNFDPSTGMEIQKRRPAIVLSNTEYNKNQRSFSSVQSLLNLRTTLWKSKCHPVLKCPVLPFLIR
ncbi:type II toxin-antitoxin system PemK/MazF family toxin [uncultured Planococcus sp.]|uniref:type II toxin-antitoxin system PemK/MazF family toxin n=1 Tax=uncultured Planococcus sp. TaxID=337815 RepID=UPI00344E40FC